MTTAAIYVERIIARLDENTNPREEPDLELKASYPSAPESETLWEMADLVASMANSPQVAGLRALVYGPQPNLTRPAWFIDETVLPAKLRPFFDAAVMPRFEVYRRSVGVRGEADIILLLDCSETPYVTKLKNGGVDVVRVRLNTGRRTARRAELLALCASINPRPLADLELSLGFGSGDIRMIGVVNIGMEAIRDITVVFEDTSNFVPVRWKSGDVVIPELRPGENDSAGFMYRKGGGLSRTSMRALVRGTSEQGYPVEKSIIVDPNQL